MIISRKIYEEMIRLPMVPPEIGGILGEKEGIICYSFLDQTTQSAERAIYCPNTQILNHVINEWNEKQIRFAGFFHTHLPEQIKLSNADRGYIDKIVEAFSETCEHLYFPIVIPGIKVLSYNAVRENGSTLVFEDKLTIYEGE